MPVTRRPYANSYPNVPEADGTEMQARFDACDRRADDPRRVLSLFLRGDESHGAVARGVHVAAWGLTRCYGCPDTGFARCKALPPYPLRCADCLVALLRDGGARRLYTGPGWNGTAADTSHETADVATWEQQVDRALAGGETDG